MGFSADNGTNQIKELSTRNRQFVVCYLTNKKQVVNCQLTTKYRELLVKLHQRTSSLLRRVLSRIWRGTNQQAPEYGLYKG